MAPPEPPKPRPRSPGRSEVPSILEQCTDLSCSSQISWFPGLSQMPAPMRAMYYDRMRNLFTHPKRLPLIAPSILSADFANMGEDCRSVLAPMGDGPRTLSALAPPTATEGRADLLHVDVMDGHFVPNLTMGPDMCRSLRRALPDSFLDVHLMVTDPWLYAKAFVDAGANHLTFHVEVIPPDQIARLADQIRELGVTVGLALNPPTPVEAVMPHIDHFDLILVMSVNPGRSGQSFIPEVLSKVETLADCLSPLQRLQMDGGVNLETARHCLDAGCDVLVAASAIFGQPAVKRPGIIKSLRSPP